MKITNVVPSVIPPKRKWFRKDSWALVIFVLLFALLFAICLRLSMK